MTEQAPIFIMGMHRSGTSCLAGCLEEAGLYLGEVNRWAPFNQKGNNENQDIMALNDAVLASNGGSWDQPPEGPVCWSAEHLTELAAILARYPDDRIWGMKDPRTLLTLEGWLNVIQPRFVGTFRHPDEVRASLQRRAAKWGSEMSDEHAYGVWRAYNSALLALHGAQPFPVLNFSVDLEVYKQSLVKALDHLGLDTASYQFRFLEEGLKNESASGDIPDSCAVIWEKLNEIAL